MNADIYRLFKKFLVVKNFSRVLRIG